jgi:general secretion pathway protein N
MKVRTKAWWGAALAVSLTVLATASVVLARANATWLDWGFGYLSQGRVALAEAQGTLWQGSGRLVLVDIAAQRDANQQSRGAQIQRTSLHGVAVPGRVNWRLNPWPLCLGRIDLQLRLDGMSQDIKVHGSPQELSVSQGSLTLPSVDLSRLGSPWSTLRPAGALSMTWEALKFREQGFDGKVQLELREASAAISPVNPVGSYRVDLSGQGADTGVVLSTLQGPLRLTGNGRFNARTGLSLNAEAIADEAERVRMQSMLGLIGRREGDKIIIKIGA